MSTLTQQTTGPARWRPSRMTAAVLSFVAAMLALVSSFLPLFTGSLSTSGLGLEMTITAWGLDVDGGSEFGDVPNNGYPLIFAAIVLVCAAVGCWLAASPASTPGTQRVAGVTTAVGGAFLLGAVWTVALQVASWVDTFTPIGNPLDADTDASAGVGHWLLITAAFMGVVAAVLALLPARQPTWEPPRPMAPDMATPPYGIALPVPQAAPAPVVAVDPLTGQPTYVDPLTGLPATQGPYSPPAGMPAPQFAQSQPIEPIGYEMPPGAQVPHNTPVSPDMPAQAEHSPIPVDQPVAFTQEPVPAPGNGLPSVVEPAPPAPIVLPAPPPEGPPPGPAVPASEDPLAEPRND